MTMKIKTNPPWLTFALILAALCPLICRAQISLGVKLASSRIVLHEPFNAEIAVKNTSGRLLSFGSGEGFAHLGFQIEDAAGRVLQPNSDTHILDGVDIMPGETRAFSIDLSSFFPFHAARIYRIKAVLEWDSVLYVSRAAPLEVVRGFELVKINAGIPGDPEASRTYVLEYAKKERDEHLYLCIRDEAKGNVQGVFNLGRVVRVRKPELRTDDRGNVHVLFQTTGMSMVHAAYTPYGSLLFSNGLAVEKGEHASFEKLPDGRLTVALDSGSAGIRDRQGQTEKAENSD